MGEALTRSGSAAFGGEAVEGGMGNGKGREKANEEAESEGGVMGRVGLWIERSIEEDGERGVRMDDAELARRLRALVRPVEVDADDQDEGAGDGMSTGTGAELRVSEAAVKEIVAAVKKELEKCCVVIDGDEWLG